MAVMRFGGKPNFSNTNHSLACGTVFKALLKLTKYMHVGMERAFCDEFSAATK